MSTSSIEFHLFHGPHSGYLLVLVGALGLAVYSCFVDIFIDESESAPSEEARQRWGIKATKTTRTMMVSLFLLIALFAIWKMWQP